MERLDTDRIQLEAFAMDLYGIPYKEIAEQLVKQFGIRLLTEKQVKALIDAETIHYGLQSERSQCTDSVSGMATDSPKRYSVYR